MRLTTDELGCDRHRRDRRAGGCVLGSAVRRGRRDRRGDDEPNSVGLLIVYENLWSLPFATAARQAGGQLVARGHISTQAIIAALDAVES